MPAFIDTHIHIYDSYNIPLLLQSFRDNVIRAKTSVGVMILTERYGVNYFEKLRNKEGLPDNVEVIPSDETSYILRAQKQPDIIVMAGRQIACKERIEVLALGTSTQISDGISIHDAIDSINAISATPVLAWGVGKWLFNRANIIKSIISDYNAQALLIGDSALRPTFWNTPSLMQKAINSGFTVIAGSDPLPSSDQALRAGQYGELFSGFFDLNQPLTQQVLNALKSKQTSHFGRRSNVIEFLKNLH